MGCLPQIDINIPPWIMATLRVVQFLDALISLIIYAVYLAKAPSASQVVLGIAAAATIWVVIAVIQWFWKHREDKKSKRKIAGAVGIVLLVLLIDVIFVGLFIGVAAITGPAARNKGACSGDHHSSDNKRRDDNNNHDNNSSGHLGCGDSKALFALAIINIGSFSGSSILNALQSMQRPPNPKTFAQNPINDLSNIIPQR